MPIESNLENYLYRDIGLINIIEVTIRFKLIRQAYSL